MRAALHSPASTDLILPEEVGARAMFFGTSGEKSGRPVAAQNRCGMVKAVDLAYLTISTNPMLGPLGFSRAAVASSIVTNKPKS